MPHLKMLGKHRIVGFTQPLGFFHTSKVPTSPQAVDSFDLLLQEQATYFQKSVLRQRLRPAYQCSLGPALRRAEYLPRHDPESMDSN